MKSQHGTEVYAIQDIADVDYGRLYKKAGVRLLTLDLDKTIAGQHDEVLTPERISLFQEIGRIGFLLALASNAHSDERIARVYSFAEQISYAASAACVPITPKDAGGNKKPAPDMLQEATQLTLVDPIQAVHFGDQVRSDGEAAIGAGFRSFVAVAPYGKGDDPIVRLVGRPFIEPKLRREHGLPASTKDFPRELPDAFYRTR